MARYQKLGQALRWPFVTCSLLGTILGVCGMPFSSLSFIYLWVMLLGVGCSHLSANLWNDYYDALDTDPLNFHYSSFNGGSRVIQLGWFQRKEIMRLAFFFGGMAILCGGYLFFHERPYVLYFMLLGGMCGFLYSAHPIRLVARGWGEVIIFLSFGPLLVGASSYVLTNALSFEPFLFGLPYGFMVANILFLNEFPDRMADKKSKKNTWVVLLGLERSCFLFFGIGLLAYAALGFLVLEYHYSLFYLFPWVTFPFFLMCTLGIWESYNCIENMLKWQKWNIVVAHFFGVFMLLGWMATNYLG